MNIPFQFNKDKVLDITDLLPTIPLDLLAKVGCYGGEVSKEEEDFLKSAGRAVENANQPVLKGLSAIGVLLANANEEIPLETFNDVGWLIQSLSDQVLALSNMQGFAESILEASNKNKILKGNGGLMS
ncbi:hypothetical protein F909_04107 [Acinetobacter sp. ANC 3929]|uniref:hypothetical protein n=1 Tax=Acinetobacter TaxID=469 RepID=UPI0002CDFF3B|nr:MULTISPECIES: hypothetical protein [Acinetobacter]ENW78417.1 hypothetical protein F909_04107 [Acinetobacter sp. ANC 3929]ENX48644.1 hypothetical protein F943_02177 [Acinetobacter ursingii NIPH 706]